MRNLAQRVVTVIAALICAFAETPEAKVVETSHRPVPSSSWVSMGPARPTDTITVRLALAQRNLVQLEDLFWRVSDPRSLSYGKYMTAAEIGVLIGLEDHVLEQVHSWADAQGCITARSMVDSRDYLHLTMPVDCAERIFAVQLHRFASTARPQAPLIFSQGPQNPTLPLPLKGIVVAVHGLTLPYLRAQRIKGSKGVSKEPGDQTTPTVLAGLYNYTSSTSRHGAGIALAEFEDDAFIPSDIQEFLGNYSLPTDNVTRIVGFDDVYDGYVAESSLDIQYAMAVAGPGVEAWVFITDQNLGFDLTAWALNVTGTPGAPKVHSISWGSPESAFKAEDMARDNIEFQKMGLMGFTVLVASGDNGPGKRGFLSCKGFDPQFPATSPYVTAVGGTYLSSGQQETGWSHSGGGFSNAFAIPEYQQAAVSAYLSSASLPDAKLFNRTGRAIPDVSALATNYRVLMQGFWDEQVSGTSASCPVWAALLALVNDRRLAGGKRELGFVNPALYQLGVGVGQDITLGTNKASGCKEGFEASAGWDPVTGWGTPSFPALLKSLAEDLP